MITQQTVLDGIREVARDREVITYPPLWDWLEHHFGLAEKEINETWGRKSYKHGVRSHVSDLREAGVIKRVGRGRYVLNQKNPF